MRKASKGPNTLPLVPHPPSQAHSARRSSSEMSPSYEDSSSFRPVFEEGTAAGTSSHSYLEAFSQFLTEHEKMEVLKYDEVYYAGQNCTSKIKSPVPGASNFGYDDERGDYQICLRDHLHYRYELLECVGRGSFGQVMKALDHKTGSHVAVKIIRNKKRFHQQAEIEVRILSHLRDRDPEGKYGVIHLVENFAFRNHVCLTYELLSINLYEYMKQNKFYPLPLPVVKKMGASILISLAFMWREKIIHCDLKPENILLRQPNRTGVKVIDLGSACFESDRLYTYIQSRFYRAPEIILGISYSKRIDLWSYACVLCELATGYPLFPGENEGEQLACIMEYLDVPPKYVLDSASRKASFFDSTPVGFAPKLVPNSRNKIRQPAGKSLGTYLNLHEDDPFIDFIRMFLKWDAEERPPPEAAMRHPWICDSYVGITPKVPVMKRGDTRLKSRHCPTPPSEPNPQSCSARAAVPTLPNINSRRHSGRIPKS